MCGCGSSDDDDDDDDDDAEDDDAAPEAAEEKEEEEEASRRPTTTTPPPRRGGGRASSSFPRISRREGEGGPEWYADDALSAADPAARRFRRTTARPTMDEAARLEIIFSLVWYILGATNARGVGRERRGNFRGGCMSKLCVE